MKPLSQLKSSAYYKKWAKRLDSPSILMGVLFASILLTGASTITVSHIGNKIADDFLHSETNYYEYVEEKTAEYDESLNNGSITQNEHDSLTENLKDKNDYFDNYASAEEKEKYNNFYDAHILKTLGTALGIALPPPLITLITVFSVAGSMDKKAKRAEFKEKQEANDTIKTNYDPKYQNINDYNDFEIIK